MNKVERAVIMAAGIGRRLQPVTLSIPKPLVKVNGVRMIESIIRALHQNGITEIYVVVGYLKEQFKFLEKKYENLKLIENPHYDTCNNISSLYVARNYIENAFILDGDQIIINDRILSPIFDKSGYSAVWTDEVTDEWLMSVDKGIVSGCSKNGGQNGWQLYSLSRWSANDAKKMKHQLEYEFERGNTDVYWDDIPMFLYSQDYQLGIYPIKPGDLVEIDNYDELIKADCSYKIEE